MKQRKRWLGLAAAPFALAFLAFAQPAHAADYSGNCALIPNHVTGNATVTDTTCVIDTGATLIVDGTLTIDADSVDVKSEIQSVGKVTVRTNGGGELKLRKKASSQNNDILLQSPQNRIETKGLEAGNSVQVDAGLLGAEGATWDIKVDGQIIINKVQSSPTNPNIHGNVLLRAVGPISTKTIKTDGDLGAASVKSGGVQIEAYRSGAGAANASEFVIGGSTNPNGVNGNIITQSTIGGGTSASFVNGGIYVTMGGPANTGNIRVADMSAIKVRATQSRSGWIIFNANAGTIFLPAGNLNTSGDDTNNTGAGLIYLMAKTLDTQPGTIISANQTETAAGTGHQIFIAVETLKYRGNGTDGLKILNDGNGGSGFFSLVNISPKDYLVPGMLTSNVNMMPWNFSLSTAELAKDGPLTIDGTEGNAALVLRADGNTAAVNVSGYPLAFSGGDVTIRSRGQTLHRINIGYYGSITGGRPGLSVANTGNWLLDANGQAPSSGGSAAGGIIQIKADQTSLNAPIQNIRADGASDAGDGGIVYIETKTFSVADSPASGNNPKVRISADGAPNGVGNAVTAPLDSNGPFAVTLKSGASDLVLGGGNKAIRITANGGKTSGNGGTVKVLPTGADVQIRDSLALDVSAIGTTCTSCIGGQIQVIANNIDSKVRDGVNFSPALKANGSGTSSGGLVNLKASTHAKLAGDIQVTGGCQMGDGGTIKLEGSKVSTLGTDDVGAAAGQSGTCLAVAAVQSLSPTAVGTGKGGDHIVVGDEWVTGPLTVIHADGSEDGPGGFVDVQNTVEVNLVDAPENLVTAKAGSSGNGEGGKIKIAKAKAPGSYEIDVNRIFSVDGGSNTANSTFFGSIDLNGVVCQQWKFDTAWPTSYWDCANPDAARNTVPENILHANMAQSLNSTLKARIGNPDAKTARLYIFASVGKFNDFFDSGAKAGDVGNTFISKTKRNIYVSIHKTNENAVSQTETKLNEASAHELAHAIDMTATPPYDSAPSVNTTYNTYVLNDLLYLDYSFTEEVFGLTPRHPCKPTVFGNVTIPGPLDGVSFKQGNAFVAVCDGAGNVNPLVAPLKNSAILAKATSYAKQQPANSSQDYPGGWAEVHSRMFSSALYMLPLNKNPNESNNFTEYFLATKGFYRCSLDWANHLISPSTNPPASSGDSETPRQCNETLPAWYTPF